MDDPRRWVIRVAASVIGLAAVWLTVLAFTSANPVDLTVALLVVLAEVLAVAVLSGPVLAVIVALMAVFLVNWYLVPPYGTFAIASAENVVALVVFTLVAAVAATLVEVGARARARAQVSQRQADLLGEILVIGEDDDAATAVERIRSELHLDAVELVHGVSGSMTVVARAGRLQERGEPALEVLDQGAFAVDVVGDAIGFAPGGHGGKHLAWAARTVAGEDGGAAGKQFGVAQGRLQWQG